MNKKRFIFLFILVNLLFCACNRNSIVGIWKNDDRILEFTDCGEFKIKFKKSSSMKSFSGSYIQKKDIVVLLFEEYETMDGTIGYTSDTDLANFKEIMEVSVDNLSCLHTKIISTGKEYSYSREEMN